MQSRNEYVNTIMKVFHNFMSFVRRLFVRLFRVKNVISTKVQFSVDTELLLGEVKMI
jgi:hypothetical protein